MEVWIRNTINYSVFKIIKILLIDKIKSIHLNTKIMDCVFNQYLKSRNDYTLLEVEFSGLKKSNHTYTTFSESRLKELK